MKNNKKTIIDDMFFVHKMTRKQISIELGISISTVSTYIREIRKERETDCILLKNGTQLKWSNDETLLSASSQGIGGYSNSYKDYTYRIIK